MAARKKVKKQLFLVKYIRVLLLALLLTSTASAIYLLISSYNKPDSVNNDLLYSYKGNMDVDYKVNLYENDYTDGTVLPSGGQYIADLVKNLEAEFTYNYNASKILDLKYTYNIKAAVYGEYNIEDEQEKVLRKEYVLLDTKSGVVNDTSSFSIKEPLTINYKFYNNVITSFKHELNLPVDAYVNITFTVNVLGMVDGETINDTKTKSLSIPLDTKAFKISKIDNYGNNKSFKKDVRHVPADEERFDKDSLIIGIMLTIFTIVIFSLSFRAIFGIRKKNNYSIKLKKILKDYGDIIVQIANPIDDSSYDIVEVTGFNEMIDLEEELRTPINFYETNYGYEGLFTLINNNILYKYILDNKEKKID